MKRRGDGVNWMLMAFVAGGIVGLQAVINARLGRELGNPALATLASFAVGIVFVGAYCVLARVALPDGAALLRVPVWAWFGGLLGACYVAAIIMTTPRLGTGAVAGLAIAGQMLMAVGLDHWGLLGLERHPVSPGRLLGMALLVAGVVLLKRF